jgi:hypothetical protein
MMARALRARGAATDRGSLTSIIAIQIVSECGDNRWSRDGNYLTPRIAGPTCGPQVCEI